MSHYNSFSWLPLQDFILIIYLRNQVPLKFFHQSNYSLAFRLKKTLKLSIPIDTLTNLQYSSSSPLLSSLLTESPGLSNKKSLKTHVSYFSKLTKSRNIQIVTVFPFWYPQAVILYQVYWLRLEKGVTGDENWIRKWIKIRSGKLCSMEFWLKIRGNHIKMETWTQQIGRK